MTYVIRIDGRYVRGRDRWLMVLVDDLQKARTYPSKAAASGSRTAMKNPYFFRSTGIDASNAEIIEVKLTEVIT